VLFTEPVVLSANSAAAGLVVSQRSAVSLYFGAIGFATQEPPRPDAVALHCSKFAKLQCRAQLAYPPARQTG